MTAKILFITDLHKRYKDSANIKGQLEVQQKIQEDIIRFNIENGITHNIILGDWYDRGFHGLCQAYGAIEMDRRLSNSVNGNVYLCVGNHFYLERDDNPEMYIIQPNEYIKPSQNIPVPDKPVFNVVPELFINGVQISFFHFNKINKDYKANRRPDARMHIGIYHDDAVVPGNIRAMEGYSGTTSQKYLCDVYDNVDLAIHGHIHCAVGTIELELMNGKKLPLIIPGALAIVANRNEFKHPSVDLPLITIDDSGNPDFAMVTFSTHLNDLRFYDKKEKKKPEDNVMKQLLLNPNASTTSAASLQSLGTYLSKKGYNELCMHLVDSAKVNNLDISTAINILKYEGDPINE